jgi:Fe-S oxidoreductase
MIGPLAEQRYALESIYKYGNPYGQEPVNRLSWLGDLKVKLLPKEKAEVIYYVGCTTSYEPELHNLARSIVKLLKFFEIDFGILEDEVCCGDPARTLGEEGLFQEEAWQNLDKIKSAGAKTILTTSPHCFHTFLNKYEDLGNQFHIKHYTEFLHSLFQEKNVPFEKQLSYTITYHDPCYLGKHNDIYDPPRALLQAIPGIKLVEMSMTGKNSLCCGGGGGRMYAEVEEERRMADVRIGQALEVEADVIATACPWCHNMLQNAVRDLQMEDQIKVRDIAEILTEALNL